MSRVTDKMVYSQANNAITRTRKNMVKAQEDATTGKRIHRPSDDPTGTVRSLDLKQQLAHNKQMQSSINTATSVLRISENALGDLSDVIARAKELAISMSNTTNQERAAFEASSREVEQLFLRALQIGNTRIGDRYVFGGYQTLRAPFDTDGNYYGDDGVMEVEINNGQRIGMNLPGNLVFFGQEKLEPQVQEIRQDPLQNSMPSIEGSMHRAPSSVEDPNPEKGQDSAGKKPPMGAPGDNMGPVGSGANVLRTLKSFTDALRNNDKLGINDALDNLDHAFEQVVTARSLVGSRSKVLELTQASLEHDEVTKLDQNSRIEDADALKVFSDLAKEEHTLNASLETSKRLITPSLLDFLK
jgi:flagellar hook-associated protein 3 FlgL